MKNFQKEHYAQVNNRIEFFRKNINFVIRNYQLSLEVADCFVDTLKNLLQSLQSNKKFAQIAKGQDFAAKMEADLHKGWIEKWIETMEEIEAGTYYLGCW